MSFEDSFSEVIEYEVGSHPDGGYTNDPLDAGGETKWGISKRANPELDIKNLTKEEAKQVYWKKYWNPLLLAQVQSGDVATELFEQAVNCGLRTAALHAQQAVNLCDEAASLSEDGQIGPKTIAAINKLGQRRTKVFLKCLNGLQFVKYLEIVRNNSTQRRFFVGWLSRVNINGKAV